MLWLPCSLENGESCHGNSFPGNTVFHEAKNLHLPIRFRIGVTGVKWLLFNSL